MVMAAEVDVSALEQRRVAAVRETLLLDTAPEPEFDELVATAAAVCGVPMSVVSLIDDKRQFLKAAIGIEVRETPREIAFCDYAIRQPGMLMVEDARQDDRFRNNPAVTPEDGIRFYAGVPLLNRDGHALGTLCVFDRRPGALNEAQASALKALAQQVNSRIELRVQRRQLERALAELRQANLMLEHLAATDGLTGLAHRRTLDDRLGWEIAQRNRNHRPLAMLMCDLDHFKARNDTFGHEDGDRTLRQFAELLRHTVRESDLPARYGGEEFAVLLPETDEPRALVLAERVVEAVRAAQWPHRPVTVSIGVGAITIPGQPAQELCRAADAALYAAKHAGRNRVIGASRDGVATSSENAASQKVAQEGPAVDPA